MNKKNLTIRLLNFPSLSYPSVKYPEVEFHILASVRKKYSIDKSLFSSSGNVIFPNYHTVRVLAQKMNSQLDLQNKPEQAIHAGQLNAMGLIDEIYHYVLRLYEETANPSVFRSGLETLSKEFGTDTVNKTLVTFSELFPPLAVYRDGISADQHLAEAKSGKSNKEIALEEIILLYFANFNPAFKRYKELFNEKDLIERTSYLKNIERLEKFFRTQKRFGPENLFIFDLLRAPILASPDSLAGQLDYIKRHWGLLLGEKFINRILGADDLIKEDSKIYFPSDSPISQVPDYTNKNSYDVQLLDLERFSSDLEWMPNVVLIAKNIYVWLDQLSRKYNRHFTKLNDIPDKELETLAGWNISSLWLIGVWERSNASQKIKQWTGNPEAAASAYSLYDYVIANDLGGEKAFQNLKERAWKHGIRLAGDMVPNHMGIFSKWIIEHPEYFIQSEYPPFPNYSFNGGNLSDDPNIEIRIEDGYWQRHDAAVVFQRIDRRNQTVRYIYHGNDGTHMPWNDTAQLNFMKHEVREAVIQTIFHVARKFPIIRFDAAMILTKKHFQRLWFPQPGKGGDIPSRSDSSMATDEFNKVFPNEFWREVVDRINTELPNTLLLAEAFWLLEGYFVRTLGMHRVYNSAFMNMLKMEENSKYRELIKNTMHYNPEILKRYVNFMSNPDEQTAIAQFGKEDKYFGITAMMVTLPGLPMFGHGQIEGFTEKYGMEYKRAYYNEEPDTQLIKRHEAEIFPLLGRRYLFCQVNNFELYDFIDINGNLNNDLFAYSNKMGNDRVVVCFHNKYAETSGRIKMTVGRNIGTTDNPSIASRTIGEALECSNSPNFFYTFRDQKSNLNYIRSGKDLHEKGIYIELKAYNYHVFMDFKEIFDDTGEYERLASHLHGMGVHDINEELHKVRLFPIFLKLYDLFENKIFEKFLNFINEKEEPAANSLYILIEKRFKQFSEQIKSIIESSLDVPLLINEYSKNIHAIKRVVTLLNKQSGDNIFNLPELDTKSMLILHAWAITASIENIAGMEIIKRLRLINSFCDIFESHDINQNESQEMSQIVMQLLHDNGKNWCKYFSQKETCEIIGVNEHNMIRYFNKERFEELVGWHFRISLLSCFKNIDDNKIPKEISKIELAFNNLIEMSSKSKYRYDNFISQLQNSDDNKRIIK
jgi:glycosidase